jgi:hypothetical protein
MSCTPHPISAAKCSSGHQHSAAALESSSLLTTLAGGYIRRQNVTWLPSCFKAACCPRLQGMHCLQLRTCCNLSCGADRAVVKLH